MKIPSFFSESNIASSSGECDGWTPIVKITIEVANFDIQKMKDDLISGIDYQNGGLMSIFWTQKVKLFYAALLANNSHWSGVM